MLSFPQLPFGRLLCAFSCLICALQNGARFAEKDPSRVGELHSPAITEQELGPQVLLQGCESGCLAQAGKDEDG